jgi:hypothetical protein
MINAIRHRRALDWVKCSGYGWIMDLGKLNTTGNNHGPPADSRIESCPYCQNKSVSGPRRRCGTCGREWARELHPSLGHLVLGLGQTLPR